MSAPLSCESCGAVARIRLTDGSTWCSDCDAAAHNLGYGGAAVVHVAGGWRNHVQDAEHPYKTVCGRFFCAYVVDAPSIDREFCVKCERWMLANEGRVSIHA